MIGGAELTVEVVESCHDCPYFYDGAEFDVCILAARRQQPQYEVHVDPMMKKPRWCPMHRNPVLLVVTAPC